MTHATIEEAHVGDVGTDFVVTIREGRRALDVSSATSMTVLLKPPQGAIDPATGVEAQIVSGVGSFLTDGTDGKVRYKTVAGDLTVPGRWGLQARVALTTPPGIWSTEVGSFPVKANLDD